jgi:peptidyl-prolyl cis-trans isomerase SurA
MRTMKIFGFFVCGLVAALTLPLSAQAGKEGIAVVVNQDVVTMSDVGDRLKLIAVSTGLPDTPELTQKLRPQIVEMLVEEQIKSQEARRLDLKTTPEEVTEAFGQIAAQNNISADEFKKMLKSRGIRLSTLDDQIRTQILWTKVVQRKLRPQVDVSDADIDSEMEKLRENIGKTQYRVAEIFLPVTDPQKDAQAKGFAAKLVAQLRKQPELFPKVARQFSQAPGAAQGGSLGWVSEGQLAQEVDGTIRQMEVGGLSDPVKSLSGYHIVLLQDKRQIAEEHLPPREEILQRLGTQRLDLLQRRYLLDLRSAAFIEKRD